MPFKPTFKPDLGEVTSAIAGVETTFKPYGIIAPWYSGLFFSFMTANDTAAYKPDLVDGPKDSEWKTAFFIDSVKARAAAKVDGQQYGPNHVWRMMAMVKDALNIDPEFFQNSTSIPYVINMTGLDSKYRHTYHLMALPSAVHAGALLAGYSEDELPKNPLSELLGNQVLFDENFELEMIGDPMAKPDQDNHWTTSKLGKWRADLWRVLGESDVLKYSANPQSGDKVRTDAEALQFCLQFAGSAWTKPMYARVVGIPDPLLKATYLDKKKDEDKRRQVGVIWELFASAKDAKTAADEEAKERDERAPATSSVISTNGASKPALPDGMEGMEDEFTSAFADACQPGVKAIDVAKTLGMPVALVAQWKKYLDLQ